MSTLRQSQPNTQRDREKIVHCATVRCRFGTSAFDIILDLAAPVGNLRIECEKMCHAFLCFQVW